MKEPELHIQVMTNYNTLRVLSLNAVNINQE